ncbi:MAG TPA: hypothetical protein PKJ20_03950 [Bacillota bacterium]|nr:hypothetical protein [Bacillota bacterium]
MWRVRTGIEMIALLGCRIGSEFEFGILDCRIGMGAGLWVSDPRTRV